MKNFTFLFLLLISTLGYAQVNLPIDFETTPVTADFIDFDGGTATVIANPQSSGINTSATVAQIIRDGGQPWGGSKLVLANTLDFTTNNSFSMKVFSPAVGIPVLFKLEGNGNATPDNLVNTTVANEWETLTWNYTGTPSNIYNELVFIFDLGTVGDGTANSTFLFDDIQFIDNSGGLAQVDLPVTFEDAATVFYDLTDFGGNASSIVVDPTDPTNMVGQAVKTAAAELWAGTTMGGSGLATIIPLSLINSKMTARVWSPDAGTPIRLKVENANDPTQTCETETNTTIAGGWETIEFNFATEAPGTAALSFGLANGWIYNKVSIFFNFGTDGATAGEKTYYWDDVTFGGGGGGLTQVDLPVTFEDANTDYSLTDFGGNASSIVVDPTDPTNMVGQAIKAVDAQLWAGTTMGDSGLATAIPFVTGSTTMTVRVWSPDAGIQIRLKAEDTADPTISVETEAMTTAAGAWEMLTFDFSNEATGTAAINFANVYDKISIFFNFGTDGATAGEKTYYWDDVMFSGGGGGLTQVDLPVTFEDANTDYNLTDFGGNGSSIVVDPTDPTNMVGQAIKAGDAQLWAGTTMGGSGLATAIPFITGSTIMTARVWSPDAGTPIRLKVENTLDGTISVETEATTTVAGGWEMLTFDFSNEAAGTAAINLANVYDKISIFFNFGTDGATAGEKTYYWDDVMFGGGGGLTQVDLPVTFEDANTDYNLTDFGGNGSSIVVDPTDPTNMVGQAIKAGDAQLWAGTTMGGSGLATAIPFVTGSTTMTARVWSPDAGTPIRLKVENTLDGTISVETEATTTVAGGWEMLTFDFSNEAAGTAAINLANVYDKISIFFNFGTDGATAGEKTYYWDDVMFGGGGGLTQIDLPITFEDANTDYNLNDFGGNGSLIIIDPTDPGNLVGQAIKAGDAQLWAGTTMGDSGLANAIPFATGDTKMTVRVWSPDAGTPIRLKAEDTADPTISVETEATTTVAGAWETLEFDFSNEATGTAAINFANTYDKISIFFNFGTDGATAGEKTYYWDDVMFGPITSIKILNAAESGIKISPNPSSSFFNIEFPEVLTEPVHMMLFDVNGKLLKEGNVVDQISQINVSELNSGMYFLRMDRGGVSYFQKVMVSK